MNLFLVAFLLILPPLLFAITNLIDNKLVEDYNPAPLMAIGGVFNLIVSLILLAWILIVKVDMSIDFSFAVLMANGLFYTLSIFIYLKVIQTEEVSRAVPFFQSIPVYGLFGGYIFLDEKLETIQVLAILLLAVGGGVLIIKDGVARKRMAFMMIISSLMIAVNDVIFANYGREIKVLPALFADTLGKSLWGMSFVVKKEYRSEFFRGLKSKFKLQAVNELIFILADLIFDWTKILVPVALAQGMCAAQPLFLLILVCLATKFFPKFHTEEMSGIAKWQKWTGVSLMVVGGIILST